MINNTELNNVIIHELKNELYKVIAIINEERELRVILSHAKKVKDIILCK